MAARLYLKMTDEETIRQVLNLLGMPPGEWRLIRRNGRTLLGLPPNKDAARRAIALYQPQRFKARTLMAIMRWIIEPGLHRCLLPALHHATPPREPLAELRDVASGSAGILLGSPEHRVRRAITSYRLGNEWEVAKVVFGDEGAAVLEQEAGALTRLAPMAEGVPRLLGIHRKDSATLLRMLYLTGARIKQGDHTGPLSLLNTWMRNQQAIPISRFPEWNAIRKALADLPMAANTLEALEAMELVPVICHGDFARWNLLRQHDGGLMALDWEWGHEEGMPGLDLVHYFLQDHRLVNRLSDDEAILATRRDLNRPDCMTYLRKAGWRGNPLLPIIASLAWKQGAGHQENSSILKAAVTQSGHE